MTLDDFRKQFYYLLENDQLFSQEIQHEDALSGTGPSCRKEREGSRKKKAKK